MFAGKNDKKRLCIHTVNLLAWRLTIYMYGNF